MNHSADTQPTLLLVDGDRSFCIVMADALRTRGYEVRIAHDVAQGLAAASLDPPEYAEVDLKMPRASGLDLVRSLKRLEPQTRIIVFTGYASVTTAIDAIKLGATHSLAKPADADKVIAALHRGE